MRQNALRNSADPGGFPPGSRAQAPPAELAQTRRSRDRRLDLEALYRELAESISDPFYALDRELKCTYWNSAAERLTGIPEQAALGKPPAALSPNSRIASRGRAVFRRVLRKQQPESFVTVFPGPGGERSLEVRVYPSRSGLSVFARDVTARMAREAERDRLLLELAAARDEAELRAREAEESERQLAETMQQLERSNGELDHFASVVASDLREPLRAVTGFARLLEARNGDRLDAQAGAHLAQIIEGTGRMASLIEALLEYARLDRRRKRAMPTDLNRVLGKAILNLAVLREEHGAEITQERLPTVLADEQLMIELFQNLLANAIAFRGAGRPRIHVAARIRDGRHMLSVTDNGIGIEERHFERIFMVFKRLQVRPGLPGTGIGLALCKKIVEHHAGRIWVESEPGRGSTFSFTLPLAPEGDGE